MSANGATKKDLFKAIHDLKIHCVNHHADMDRLIGWLTDPNRPPANVAFTEGPERQIAYQFDRFTRNVEGGSK